MQRGNEAWWKGSEEEEGNRESKMDGRESTYGQMDGSNISWLISFSETFCKLAL